ncbi:hypothetical protein M404DRAFT_502438 [Pisolithus tinctorius Marx 270]|uniref:Uncharacterized protein n=1 Tax=Pisolithus tinctorius Marx 270 TaxID=870435 RepID=A0A0C3NY37_PISTI|nr:hypothetical protein M404DRAFT_502438 [Pisolithus tinctorius Marx 270]
MALLWNLVADVIKSCKELTKAPKFCKSVPDHPHVVRLSPPLCSRFSSLQSALCKMAPSSETFLALHQTVMWQLSPGLGRMLASVKQAEPQPPPARILRLEAAHTLD